jgi:hypothetical protein
MNLLGFRICIFCSIALILLPFSRSAAAQSYCPGCKAGVIGAAIGVGAGIGAGIYFIHRSHTSLTGCVQQTDNGLSLTAKDGNNYELVNAPSQVKAGERIVGTVFSGRAEAAFGFADTSCQRGVATVDEVDARTDPGSDAYCGSDHSRFAARAIRLCRGRAGERQ